MNISNNNNNTTTTKAGVDSKITQDTSKSDICNEGASKSNDDVCNVSDMLQNMSTADKEDIAVSICANCGKEGDEINNICNKCKQVRYCNAACKKKHRHKHKKDCEELIRLATEKHNEELKLAAELHDIELFKQPPPKEDCPICFLRMPTLASGRRYYNCCGKVICSGCCYAPVYDDQGNIVAEKVCPFCRTPWPSSDEEIVRRYKNRMKLNDAYATYDLGCCYRDGDDGYPQDHTKALELWHRAGELGYAKAYNDIGYAYNNNGEGVEVNKEKAIYYYELAAIGGDVTARSNLGIKEAKAGNEDRALKHFMVAVRDGYVKSLELIKAFYTNGHATKDDYTRALKVYQEYLGEIKSAQRDKAAAADDQFRYF